MAFADPNARRAYQRDYAKRPYEQEKRKKYMDNFKANHPNYFKEWEANNKRRPQLIAWRERYKESGKQREHDYRRLYGITVEQYDQLLKEQNNACALCSAGKPGGRSKHFHVDHDHATGRVRGLLCISCNVHLGWLENRKSKVEDYLK